MDELESKLRATVEPLLESGEELRGVCVGQFFARAESGGDGR